MLTDLLIYKGIEIAVSLGFALLGLLVLAFFIWRGIK